MSAVTTRKAMEPIPYGSPVRAKGEGCAVSTRLDDMIGVARRGLGDPHGWGKGETVTIQTDGGIRTQLAADATVTIGGVSTRLLAAEAHYFELRGGRIHGL